MLRHIPIWACLLPIAFVASASTAAERLNVLMITVDDMNWDSVGVFGCPIENITPNIDRLANQGMRFDHSHVTIAICQPTRAVWMTGRYPHNSGALGFDRIRPEVPTMVEALQDAGYFTGIMAKTGHVVPSRASAFDVSMPAKLLGNGRDPVKYHKLASDFFAQAESNKQPFFLMANGQDPHRPFAGSAQEASRKKKDKNDKSHQYGGGFPSVSRTITPREAVIPKFLPDIPLVRKELAEYYTSVHRSDEVVGAILRALDEADLANSTLVLFMSDHGMPLPFAKTNVWYHSTRTPLIIRWPGRVTPNTHDKKHFIAGIDIAPTIFAATGVKPIDGMDGHSFLPVLNGESQRGRDTVVTHINTIASKRSYAMRSLQNAKFGYIYNAWADGKTEFKNESQSGLSFKAMIAAAERDKDIAARVKHFVYRQKEELYNYADDPDALHNLIDDPKYAEVVSNLRSEMKQAMKASSDPLLKNFVVDVVP